MLVKTHTWVSLWFVLTAPIILWDAAYIFFRPRSMLGGDLHWIWKPYGINQNVDYVYSVEAFQKGDGFPVAESILNIIETFLNLLYVWQAHVTQSPSAPVVGFAAVIMTFSKTVLYWLQEIFCRFCGIGHNSIQVIILLWIIPNGFWLLVPGLIILRLGKDISTALVAANYVTKRKE